MKDAIVHKLRDELAERIDSERQVVYLLVEIRKLMELHKNGSSYPTLKFCCDWVAHPVMERSAAKDIVRQFDKFQGTVESGGTADPGLIQSLGEFVSFSRFNDQMGRFLASEGLDPSIATDAKKWSRFLRFFGFVVTDCPLKCVATNMRYTDHVSLKVTGIVDEVAVDAAGFEVVIEWRWNSKATGKTLQKRFTY